MKYFLQFMLGAFFNRYRGGLFSDKVKAKLSKIENAFVKKIVGFIVRGDTVNAVAFGAMSGSFFMGLGMFVGSLPAWGDYVGALGGWRTNTSAEPLHDWPPIDQFLTRFLDRPKLWGFLGLTIRGLFWGLMIALAAQSLWPLLAGLLMAPIYWICLTLFEQKGWPVAEWLFGGPFWVISLIST